MTRTKSDVFVAKYVQKHGNRHHVRMYVPAKAQALLATKQLIAILDTDSPQEAKRLAPLHILRFKAMIEEAKKNDPNQNLIREALGFRRAIANERDPARRDELDLIMTGEAELLQLFDANAADLYHGVATGTATPIMLQLDAWFAENKWKAKTTNERRSAVKELVAWLQSEGVEPCVEAVTDQLAAKFKAERLVPMQRATAIKRLSTLRGYFAWLIGNNGDATGQSLA